MNGEMTALGRRNLCRAFCAAAVSWALAVPCGCVGKDGRLQSEIQRRVRNLRYEYERSYPLCLSEKADDGAALHITFFPEVDNNAFALIRLGRQAVPALLDALEDQTVTACEFGYGKIGLPMPGPYGGMTQSPIRVSDKARWILGEITGRHFHFDSDLSPARRREEIEKVRSWWRAEP